MNGEIEVSKLTFAYPSTGTHTAPVALREVSLKIDKGDRDQQKLFKVPLDEKFIQEEIYRSIALECGQRCFDYNTRSSLNNDKNS
jgi:hypothetical protein